MPSKTKRPAHVAPKDWSAVESPPLSEKQLRAMRPTDEVVPPSIRRSIGKRGPGKAPAKVAVSLRLDPKTVSSYRATGAGWQSLMNRHLTELAQTHSPRRLKSVRLRAGDAAPERPAKKPGAR